jgi:aryl-alcohol dehydrogenase-like predicted oxidoreductase
MSLKNEKQSRRDFIRTVYAAGAALTVGTGGRVSAEDNLQKEATALVPTRPFGSSGVDVPILSLGGVLGTSEMIVFRRAFQLGVRYWDTADSYRWGNNEKAIGKYFQRFPGDRQRIFLVTKSGSADPEGLSKDLAASLERMNTDYVDLYLLHGVSDARRELTPAIKAWAEKSKREGKIRLFGFSAHKNMEEGMFTAAELGWIDGLMVSYNYRLMEKDRMKRAVDACAKAGIGLTAMKTQAAFSAHFYASIGSETDEGMKMTERFVEKGFTAEQARLKAVWENPNIASICSAMPNMTILQANAEAAMDAKKLSLGDRRRLSLYARKTAAGYCAGCADCCEPAVERRVPICDIMRYAMYGNAYGERERAVQLFRSLPADVRSRIESTDFSGAEKVCPQGIRIARVLHKAHKELG